MNKIHLIFILLCFTATSKAAITLPSLVGNNMVLQRDKPIKIWGYGTREELVTISFAGKKTSVYVGKNGKWAATLPKMAAGGPFTMVLQGENIITLTNILIGDVWICSGQSNMEFNLQDALHADQEINAAEYPNIRMYHVDKQISLTPKEDSKGNWNACTPEQAKYFPAIGYFFGRRIHRDLHVPIGLINASWGGTVIESWISAKGLLGEETFGQRAQEVATYDTLAYNTKQRALHKAWVQQFNAHDAGNINGDFEWLQATFDDWKIIDLPSAWEFTRLPDLWEMDGIVWFKKSIILTEEDLKGDAVLNLGVILNADQAFINGSLVGKTGDVWGKNRAYSVPKNLLKIGSNTITVRIENYGGDGGFMSNEEQFYLQANGKTLHLKGKWHYQIGYRLNKYDRPEKEISPNTLPTLMFNNMISPITQIAVKGVLWYQGESNWERGEQYRSLFPLMIADWRDQFKDPDLPFLYVQLANYHQKMSEPGDSYWAEVREAQDLTQKVKNTGMITAVDIGDAANIHPKNKQEVAHRLALLAEKLVYKLPIDSLSPAFKSFNVKGNAVHIQVKNSYGMLKTTDGLPRNFQIAGADQKWYWAMAKIVNETIVVASENVNQPVAVRYAWEDNPADANVVNAKGFPLLPFRTDQWKGLSSGKR